MNELQSLTQSVLLAVFGVSFALGFISQRTHFCTMGAIADVVNMEDWTRARQWLLAIGVAMLGFAALSDQGQVDASKSLYASNRFMWLSTLVGGLMFGYGMVIASGCANKALVRIGGGNIKSVVVFMTMGLSAFATMKGLTAVLRVNTVDTMTIDMPAGASLTALAGGNWVAYVFGAVLILAVLRHKDAWSLENLLAGLGVGGLVLGMWWITGHMGFVAEHPETLEPVYLATSSGRMEAFTFVSPVAQSLDWLMFFSDKSKTLTNGVASVCGVVVGAWLSAITSKTFRWEGFANTCDLANHLWGSVLMGVGGVTAMGCTFGQGLSGVSTLSLNAFMAIAAIVVGAVVAMRRQMANL
jgi:uncharacterized membrane protein YedE/YeeE